jgi:hypothetical protein
MDFSQKVGPLLLERSSDTAPPLKTLAKVIPDPEDDSPKPTKPHWERSKARVAAPVPEELAVYMLLDFRPLF